MTARSGFEEGDVVVRTATLVAHTIARIDIDRYSPYDPARWPWTACGYRVDIAGFRPVSETSWAGVRRCATCAGRDLNRERKA